MTTSSFKSVILASRPPFLILTPVCVLLSVTALPATSSAQHLMILLVLIGAVLAHASVNLFNEYLDYQSGLDATTDKTPFSGGSGALISHPAASNYVLRSAIASLCGAILIGFYFLHAVGWGLLPLGMLGVLIIVLYTNTINKHPWVCLLAPGLAFGPLMMTGAGYVLSGSLQLTILILSLLPFFMVNNLLLTNQLPDIDADKKVGRVTFGIRYGVCHCGHVYLLFTLLAGVIIVWCAFNFRTTTCLTALIPWSLSLYTWWKMRTFSTVSEFLPAMGGNVASTLITPTVLALVLWLS